MIIQMKSLQQYFLVVLSFEDVALTFECLDGIL